MIITIKGRKYRLSPGLTAFVRGVQGGAGWAFAFCVVMLMFWAFLIAATHYMMWH